MAPPGTKRKARGIWRWLLAAYLLAISHVVVVFLLGEPYPSLQGPLFSGHLQKGRTIYVPFYDEGRLSEEAQALPAREKLLRMETLALPVQRDQERFVPSLPERSASQFLIGHSLRVLRPGDPPSKAGVFDEVDWSAYRVHAPLHAPPRLEGEEDIFHD